MTQCLAPYTFNKTYDAFLVRYSSRQVLIHMISLIPPRTKKWAAFPEKERVLLFAHALEEKLFDYTVDSYKARALNVHTCVFEVGALANQVLRKRVSPGALIPVIEELTAQMKSDPVLTKVEQDRFSAYMERLSTERTNPESVIAIIGALHIELDGFYWYRLLESISSEVRKEKNSRTILALADSFISEAELQGFHRSFVFHTTRTFFWRKKICGPSDVDNFVALFRQKSREFQFLFKVSKSFLEIKEFAEHLGLAISDSLPVANLTHPHAISYSHASEQFPAFALTNPINARDSVTARIRAERRMEAFASVYAFHVHQEQCDWQPVALCLGPEHKFEGVLKPPTAAMKRCLHSSVNDCRESISEIIEVLAGVHFHTKDAAVFAKALDYHRAAAEASTAENQLIDLWAALEGFLPPPEADTTRITHYVSVLLPCLTLTYAEKLFRYVASALEASDSTVTKLVESISASDSFFHNTVRLLVSKECAAARERLFTILGENPLLRFRCFNLSEEFKNSERAHDTVKAHRTRLGWHIQRIYSTRNQIVHSAEALPYLDTLVENLHTYIDALVRSIARVGIQAHSPISIAGATKLLSIAEQSYLRELKTNKVDCSTSNFLKVVFGFANPLSPFHDHFCITRES